MGHWARGRRRWKIRTRTMPNNSGLLRFDDQAKLNAMAAERAAAGFQLGFHAIGDRANEVALDAPSIGCGASGSCCRDSAPAPKDPDAAIVSHVETTPLLRSSFASESSTRRLSKPADFDRFAQLGVIASMQPSHLLTDMNWGRGAAWAGTRTPLSYTWKSFLDHKRDAGVWDGTIRWSRSIRFGDFTRR